MRFQCRMGDDYVPPSFLAPAVVAAPHAPIAAAHTQHAPHAPSRLAAVAALGGGALLVVAGCAVIEPAQGSSKRWTVEPTLQVSHAGQTSASHYERGRHHDALQQWSRAIEAYRQAIGADTRNVEAYNALGVALAREGQIELAEATLRQAVVLAPERAHMRSNLGYVLLLADRPQEAAFQLRAALKLDEGDKVAAINLRDALARSAAMQAEAAPVQEAWGLRGATESVSVPAPITQVDVPLPLAPRPAGQVRTVGVIDTPSVGAIVQLDAVAAARADAPVKPAHAAVPAVPATPVAVSRVEVSNGNGVPGMAAGMGRWLATRGIATERLTNQRPFKQRQTVVQYREGHESAARLLAKTMAMSVQLEARPVRHLRSDVRIVLGHDMAKALACGNVERCLVPLGTVALGPR